MENRTLSIRVQEMVAEALQVSIDKVPPDLAFGGIKEWDSMGHMNVMMLLEERYGISIDAVIIAELINIPAICAHIQKTGKE